MFSKAYQTASNYTYPVIILTRNFDKSITGGVGTFIFLNEDGWFMTASHIFDIYFKFKDDQIAIQNYYGQIKAIDLNENLTIDEKNILKSQVQFDKNWLLNHSFWWAFDGLNCETFHCLRENDLAIGKFSNFDKNLIKKFPVFKNPASLPLGTSLCKLGYPFHEIKATFDEQNNSFRVADGILPIPRFPIDGIFTRMATGKQSSNPDFEVKFIETSTPGLKGQSGGPIFDVHGNVWAIQSMTVNIPLGFSPKHIENGIETVENQFLNVGLGVHIETILKFLNHYKVKYFLNEK